MGIDGIGKGGGVPPGASGLGDASAPKVGGAQDAKETGRVFEVRGEKTQATSNATSSAPSAAARAGTAHEASAGHEASAAHEASAGHEASAAREASAVERSPLDRLRAGEIDVNGYVDLKVDAATKNLHGLGRVELEQIRATLKHQMVHDPAIVDLVKQATGAVPSDEER
jgi:hypothetical protein